jgi:hypothetical protein
MERKSKAKKLRLRPAGNLLISRANDRSLLVYLPLKNNKIVLIDSRKVQKGTQIYVELETDLGGDWVDLNCEDAIRNIYELYETLSRPNSVRSLAQESKFARFRSEAKVGKIIGRLSCWQRSKARSGVIHKLSATS